MTFEQLMIELFVNHWFFTTVFFPPLTFLWAWIQDMTGWWVGSFAWMVVVGTTIKLL